MGLLWWVSRDHRRRHHLGNVNADDTGQFTILDRLLGTALPLKDKTVAVTGASGTMGRSLIAALMKQGAKPIAITTSPQAQFPEEISVLQWQLGQEAALIAALTQVDILVINHGVNVHGDRSPAAITQSLEVNALSALRLMDGFMATVSPPPMPPNRPPKRFGSTPLRRKSVPPLAPSTKSPNAS
jgi:hypothetical protein